MGPAIRRRRIAPAGIPPERLVTARCWGPREPWRGVRADAGGSREAVGWLFGRDPGASDRSSGDLWGAFSGLAADWTSSRLDRLSGFHAVERLDPTASLDQEVRDLPGSLGQAYEELVASLRHAPGDTAWAFSLRPIRWSRKRTTSSPSQPSSGRRLVTTPLSRSGSARRTGPLIARLALGDDGPISGVLDPEPHTAIPTSVSPELAAIHPSADVPWRRRSPIR